MRSDVLLVGYLENSLTLSSTYCVDLLRRRREKIKKILLEKLTGGVLFHQDDAPAHETTVAMAAIHNVDLNYSPALTPSDYYVFPQTNTELSGRHLDSDDDVTSAADCFLEVQDTDANEEGICVLDDRWTKGVRVEEPMLKNKC